MKKIVAATLKVISRSGIDIQKDYKLKRKVQSLTMPSLSKFFYTVKNYKIPLEEIEIPVRAFYPKCEYRQMIIFIHGGGWVTGNIDTYDTCCMNLAENLKKLVVSIDYRLAPEYKFPVGLEDCYGVIKKIMETELFTISSDNIILMGDSAGANIAAVVSLMARDRKEFSIAKQVLFYPVTYFEHNENSPFASIHENGQDWVLTTKKLNDYLLLYQSCDEDRKNPYFAPLLMEDLKNQPDTLLITAELDPLRDEGEEYGNRLQQAGNRVSIYRIPEVIHGFLSVPIALPCIKKSYEIIKEFLKEE